jgi:hypothetical protein
MLEEIVVSSMTGFGDCVVGFVSANLFKEELETHYLHRKLRLTLDWRCVHCPFIKEEYLYRPRPEITKHRMSRIICLFAGSDGTQAFAHYYKSPRMLNDLQNKKLLHITINQYIGRCFVDASTSREQIKQRTYQSFQTFWNNMVRHPEIPLNITPTTTTIYLRMGDKYLCDKQTDYQEPLETHYRLLQQLDEPITDQCALIGDLPNECLSKSFKNLYPHTPTIELKGPVSHSCGVLSIEEWSKIFNDLSLILSSPRVIILTNDSNFFRVVLFLKPSEHQIWWNNKGHLELVHDPSVLFAKHYTF